MEMEGLFFYQELMLLALRDKKGTIAADSMAFEFALVAAALADLLFLDRISLEQARKKKLVNLDDASSTYDPILDECLERIGTAKRRAQLGTWVSRLTRLKKIKQRAALELCRRGILRMEEDKVLLLFKRKVYPEVDPGPERELVERLREAIFTDVVDVDPRTCVLISLADRAGVLGNAFDKKALKGRKKRLEKIAEGEVLSAAVKEIVDTMQAAIAVAAIGAATTAT